MAKGPYDDIVRAVLERLGASAPKASTKAAKTGGRTAKAASVPAKTMTKAERSAANKAAWAKEKAQRDAKLAAERPAKKAARTAENKAKGVARANRKADEAYGGPGVTDIKIDKARAFYEREVDKLQRTIDATDRLLSKGSQGRRDMLKKELEGFKKKYEIPKLSAGDSLGVVRGAIEKAQKNNAWAKKRLEQVVKQTEGKTFKETVEMGSRRARAIEVKTGKKVTGSTPARITKKEADLQKRLAALRSEDRYKKVIKKADSKMGASRGPSTKPKKQVVEQESSKRLRAAQEKNSKKSVVDPKVAKMSPAERKKFLAAEDKKWKEIKNRKINQRGVSDKDAKEMLAELGKRDFVSDKRKLGPYPTTDRYGRYSGKRK
jgi:hypothetical protein